MILFPNAKINIGLFILDKRSDGFHEIETIMCPVPIFDILEIYTAETFSYHQTGIHIPNDGEKGLCERAYDLMKKKFKIGAVSIHLRKQIPVGAGLGGGSADATFTLLVLNELFGLNLSQAALSELAAELGSDCPFFVKNETSLATGRGEMLSPLPLDTSGLQIILLNPNIHMGTAEAYANTTPFQRARSLEKLTQIPICDWNDFAVNDFQAYTLKTHPQMKGDFELLEKLGASYISLSGSGSSFFGLFENNLPTITEGFNAKILHQGPLSLK